LDAQHQNDLINFTVNEQTGKAFRVKNVNSLKNIRAVSKAARIPI
jgi:hypothetical protein